MENEKFDIEVSLDDNLKVTISVQKQMTALEFMGLTQKAKQLFNIGNKELINEPMHRNPRGAKWTDEQIERLKEVYSDTLTSDIIKMPEFEGMTTEKISQKAYQLGIKKDTNVKGNHHGTAKQNDSVLFQNKIGKFSEEEVNTLINSYKRGLSASQICDRYQIQGILPRRRIHDKIAYLKRHGVI